MLQLSGTILDKQILSLRTGSAIADVLMPIINPNNLKIEGFYCQDSIEKAQLILLYQDIRDILPQGIVVDDHDVLADPEDLVRLKEILDLNFELIVNVQLLFWPGNMYIRAVFWQYSRLPLSRDKDINTLQCPVVAGCSSHWRP